MTRCDGEVAAARKALLPLAQHISNGPARSVTLMTPPQQQRFHVLESRYELLQRNMLRLAALEHELLRLRSTQQVGERGASEPPAPSMLQLAAIGNAQLGLFSDVDAEQFSDTSAELADSASTTSTTPSSPRSPSPSATSGALSLARTVASDASSVTRDETGLHTIGFAQAQPDSPPEQNIDLTPWQPPAFVLNYRNDGDATEAPPGRYDPGLVVRTVMRKPSGFAEKAAAIRQQGSVCANTTCKAALEPRFDPLRLGRGLDHARFCYYTGYYFCERCHTRTRVEFIPARVLHNWDFVKMSVCDAAAAFLDLHFDAPILHISSVNPGLYEQVPVLRAAMKLRVQLSMLFDIGAQCPKFRELFYGKSRGGGGSDVGMGLGEGARDMLVIKTAKCIDSAKEREARRLLAYGARPTQIPSCKRYLLEHSEFWSMADLVALHEVQPLCLPPGASKAQAAAVMAGFAASPLIVYLKETRTQMARHVVQHCRQSCFARGVQRCALCDNPERLVFTFDVNDVRHCTRCGAAYHKQCIRDNPDLMPAGTCRNCERRRESLPPNSQSPRK